MSRCYVCQTEAPLSPRGRCALCEMIRSIANEQENEHLRAQIETLKELLEESIECLCGNESITKRCKLVASIKDTLELLIPATDNCGGS